MYKHGILWYNLSMIIHTPMPKSKKRKPSAKQRELAASWAELINRHTPKTKPMSKAASFTYKLSTPPGRETPHYPSLNSGHHDCTKKQQHQYTGTKMIGIGTLHKSNAVPIFSEDDAKDQAKMRRG